MAQTAATQTAPQADRVTAPLSRVLTKSGTTRRERVHSGATAAPLSPPVRVNALSHRVARCPGRRRGGDAARREIHEHDWPYEQRDEPRVLGVHIRTLHRKTNKLGPPLIQTVHGVGYSLRR